MRKKILLLSLIPLLFLPVPGFTQDVEITDVEIKWIDKGSFGKSFRAKIQVTNNTDDPYGVSGRLVFYDRDGFELTEVSFRAMVKPQTSVVTQTRGALGPDEYEEMDRYEVVIQHKVRTPW
jgi:hypothetical protein